METWEDVYQIYRRIGDDVYLLASDMAIHDATLFIEAWMAESYNDPVSSLEIRRQSIDYRKQSDMYVSKCDIPIRSE